MAPVIDVHVHLTPPEIVAERDRFLAGEGAWAAMYRDPKARLASTPELLALMDEEGVEQALVGGFVWAKEETARRHNHWLMEQAALYPDRLRPLIAFDLLAPWAPRHAEELLDAGAFGLGELCIYDRCFGPPELDALEAFGEMCRQRGRVMLVHVNEPIGHQYPGKAPLEIGHIFALVRRCQGVKLILAHFGGGLPLLAALKREVKEALAQVCFDTAAMPYLYDPAAVAMALKVLGPEHFLLGTDYPLLKPSRYRKYLVGAGLTPEETDQIMGGAAAAFLGI